MNHDTLYRRCKSGGGEIIMKLIKHWQGWGDGVLGIVPLHRLARPASYTIQSHSVISTQQLHSVAKAFTARRYTLRQPDVAGDDCLDARIIKYITSTDTDPVCFPRSHTAPPPRHKGHGYSRPSSSGDTLLALVMYQTFRTKSTRVLRLVMVAPGGILKGGQSEMRHDFMRNLSAHWK